MSHPKCFRYLARLALSLAHIVAASPAWAWGDLGHRVICQIAFQGTQREDRSDVNRLIAVASALRGFWGSGPSLEIASRK